MALPGGPQSLEDRAKIHVTTTEAIPRLAPDGCHDYAMGCIGNTFRRSRELQSHHAAFLAASPVEEIDAARDLLWELRQRANGPPAKRRLLRKLSNPAFNPDTRVCLLGEPLHYEYCRLVAGYLFLFLVDRGVLPASALEQWPSWADLSVDDFKKRLREVESAVQKIWIDAKKKAIDRERSAARDAARPRRRSTTAALPPPKAPRAAATGDGDGGGRSSPPPSRRASSSSTASAVSVTPPGGAAAGGRGKEAAAAAAQKGALPALSTPASRSTPARGAVGRETAPAGSSPGPVVSSDAQQKLDGVGARLKFSLQDPGEWVNFAEVSALVAGARERFREAETDATTSRVKRSLACLLKRAGRRAISGLAACSRRVEEAFAAELDRIIPDLVILGGPRTPETFADLFQVRMWGLRVATEALRRTPGPGAAAGGAAGGGDGSADGSAGGGDSSAGGGDSSAGGGDGSVGGGDGSARGGDGSAGGGDGSARGGDGSAGGGDGSAGGGDGRVVSGGCRDVAEPDCEYRIRRRFLHRAHVRLAQQVAWLLELFYPAERPAAKTAESVALDRFFFDACVKCFGDFEQLMAAASKAFVDLRPPDVRCWGRAKMAKTLPSAAQSSATQPSATQPLAAQPAAAQLSAAQPSVAELSSATAKSPAVTATAKTTPSAAKPSTFSPGPLTTRQKLTVLSAMVSADAFKTAKPSAVAAEPSAIAAEPSTVAAEPSVVAAEPSVVAGTPGTVAAAAAVETPPTAAAGEAQPTAASPEVAVESAAAPSSTAAHSKDDDGDISAGRAAAAAATTADEGAAAAPAAATPPPDDDDNDMDEGISV